MIIRNKTFITLIAVLTCGFPWIAFAQAPVSNGNSINQRLDRIEQSLKNQGLLDMVQQLQGLEQEIKDLRGQIEVQNHTIEQLQQRQRALYTDIDQRLQGLERASTGAGSGAGATTTLTPTPAGTDSNNPPLQTLAPVENQVEPATTNTGAAPPSLSVTPPETNSQSMQTTQLPEPNPQQTQTMALTPMPSTATVLQSNVNQNQAADPTLARAAYDRAYSLLTQSQYEQAIKAFREYLAVYPNSKDADSGQYWIGEAFYVLHQYDQAIVEYRLLINNYPQSQKYSIALLKIGYCYQQLGQLDQARKTLLDLEQRYPQTTAARLAAEHLKAIDAALQQAGPETQITAPN